MKEGQILDVRLLMQCKKIMVLCPEPNDTLPLMNLKTGLTLILY